MSNLTDVTTLTDLTHLTFKARLPKFIDFNNVNCV